MAPTTLQSEHRGAKLALIYRADGHAQLIVNGLVRDEGRSVTRLKLQSVVQTDYEWHEQISGTFERKDQSVRLTLMMSDVEIASGDFDLGLESLMHIIEQLQADQAAANAHQDPNANLCFFCDGGCRNGSPQVRTLVLRQIAETTITLLLIPAARNGNSY